MRRNRGRYALVLAADDLILDALAERAGEAWVADVFPFPPSPERITMMRSKIAFLAAAREADLPIPRSVTVADRAAAREAAAAIGFPIMLKRSAGAGGNGVCRIDDAAELAARFDDFACGEALTLEEFCVGAVGGTEVFFQHGVPACWTSQRKVVCWPTAFGPSAIRRFVDEPEMAAILTRVGTMTQFHGFATVCWIRRNDRGLRLIEMNFRPGVGMHLRPHIEPLYAAAVAATLARVTYAGTRTFASPDRLTPLFPQALYAGIAHGTLGSTFALALRNGWDIPFDEPRLLLAHAHELAAWLRARARKPLESGNYPPTLTPLIPKSGGIKWPALQASAKTAAPKATISKPFRNG